MVNGAGCVTDDTSLSSDGVVLLRVLHLALLWGKPQQTGADILSFGWHLGLRARSLDDVERLLWELCKPGLVSQEWKDETPAEAGQLLFRCTPLGFEVLMVQLTVQRRRRRRRRRRHERWTWKRPQ